MPSDPTPLHPATVTAIRAMLEVTPVDGAWPPAEPPARPEAVAVGRWLDGGDRHRPLPDPEAQRDDAVRKALAITWWARTGPQRMAHPAFRTLVAWWAAADVALPLPSGDVAEWHRRRHVDLQSQLASVVSEAGLGGLAVAWEQLQPELSEAVARARGARAELAEALAPHVPGLVAPGDGAASHVAVGADRLPAYWVLFATL